MNAMSSSETTVAPKFTSQEMVTRSSSSSVCVNMCGTNHRA